jgi:hypothetical protein
LFDRIPAPYMIKTIPYTLLLIGLMMSAVKQIEQWRMLYFLDYFGVNSLIVYLTHMLIIYSPWCRNMINMNGVMGRWEVFIIVIALEFPLIYIFNHYLKFTIGKK